MTKDHITAIVCFLVFTAAMTGAGYYLAPGIGTWAIAALDIGPAGELSPKSAPVPVKPVEKIPETPVVVTPPEKEPAPEVETEEAETAEKVPEISEPADEPVNEIPPEQVETAREPVEAEEVLPEPEPAMPEPEPVVIAETTAPETKEIEPETMPADKEPDSAVIEPAPEPEPEPTPAPEPVDPEEAVRGLKNGESADLGDGRIAYKVKSGDTFSQICKKVIGTGIEEVWRAEAKRQGIDYRKIYPGKVLYFLRPSEE